ncbi:MAG: endolytic transglycosylase MltG [Cyanobacteria bacterium SBLK]|nr:endolytic transglycosylase MltG [Cyanobacteria bacterium SBLK]
MNFGHFFKWFYTLALLPGILVLSAWHGNQWWYWAMSPIAPTEKAVRIDLDVPGDTSTRQIGSDLEAAGIISSSWAWNIWAFWLLFQDRGGSFKEGTYTLSPSQSLAEIADSIWQGNVREKSFRVLEGWSIEEMGEYFENRGYFAREAFVEATRQIPSDRYPWLPTDSLHIEGFLFPDTYQLPNRTVQPQAIVNLMLDRFAEVALPLYRQNSQPTSLPLKDWVSLASLVEKEAAIATERPLIAGVYLKRLNEGIRLEADPTVEYGLGIKQTADRPLTNAQVRTPNPYNTYLNQGLPPTPIASPGLSSLQAVLAPTPTDYLFFVARYDGTHVFSKTIEEHEAAKNAIRQAREKQE